MLTALRCHKKSNNRLGETFSVHIHFTFNGCPCWESATGASPTGRGDNRNRVGNPICEHHSFEHHSQVLSPAMQHHLGTDNTPNRHEGNSSLSRKGLISQLFCLFHPHCQTAVWNISFMIFLFWYLDLKRIIYFQVAATRKHAAEPAGQNWTAQSMFMLLTFYGVSTSLIFLLFYHSAESFWCTKDYSFIMHKSWLGDMLFCKLLCPRKSNCNISQTKFFNFGLRS